MNDDLEAYNEEAMAHAHAEEQMQIECDRREYREVRTAILGSMAAWLAKVQFGTIVTASEMLAAFPVEGDSTS